MMDGFIKGLVWNKVWLVQLTCLGVEKMWLLYSESIRALSWHGLQRYVSSDDLWTLWVFSFVRTSIFILVTLCVKQHRPFLSLSILGFSSEYSHVSSLLAVCASSLLKHVGHVSQCDFSALICTVLEVNVVQESATESRFLFSILNIVALWPLHGSILQVITLQGK